MSVTRKIIDGARSGLNSLLDKVSADDTPLSGVERGELDAELERRVAARKEAAAGPGGGKPRPRGGGAGAQARRRKEAADAREKRVRSGKQAKKESEEKAREAAWQKFQAEAKRTGATSGSGSGSGPGSGGSGSGPRRPFPGVGKDDKIAKYYKTLDLPYGADFDQVKAAYRKLMRKYHPDLHVQSPQKQKAATELTMQVTQAYNELEAHLTKK